jgi:predicted enzyme related to lactoylglutathione lyase
VASEDIDADLRKAESLGGTTVVPKTEIPQVGWFAIFKDPSGNKVGLFSGGMQQG